MIKFDNGSEFKNKFVEKWCQEQNIKLWFGKIYCPSDQGAIEAFNNTVKKNLMSSFNQRELVKDWDIEKVLKSHVDKYNNLRIHSSTKFVPAELIACRNDLEKVE
jgi:transposase InsO family protein